MDSSGYRSDGVGLAVAIVNAVYGADPDVDDGEAVERSLREFGVVTRAELEDVQLRLMELEHRLGLVERAGTDDSAG